MLPLNSSALPYQSKRLIYTLYNYTNAATLGV